MSIKSAETASQKKKFILKHKSEVEDQSMNDEEEDLGQDLSNCEMRTNDGSQKIGPLSVLERQQKILKFFERKRKNFGGKKYTYECRKQVAEKRLRIKGRFVTKN